MKIIIILLLSFNIAYAGYLQTWSVETGSSRKSTLLTQLNAANAHLSSSDRMAKYEKMAASPFIFYRGSAHLFFYDMTKKSTISTSPFYYSNAKTWIQGDMHVANYGAFDDDEGDITYDLNDFDEAWVANYLFDVWRAAVSMVLVAKENGFSSSYYDNITDAFAEEYLDTLDDYRGNSNEKSYQLVEKNTYGPLDNFLEDVEDKESREEMLDEWTNISGGKRYFDISHPDLEDISSSEYNEIAYAISQYKNNLTSSLDGNYYYFTILDIAKRINAGTGSLGMPRYYVLIQGPSSSDYNQNRILDVKMQQYPAIYNYLSSSDKSTVTNYYPSSKQGCRVADAEKAMLTDANDHLGCATIYGETYSVRERSPYKKSFKTEELTSSSRFYDMAEQWGIALATDHARADVDYDYRLVKYQLEDMVYAVTDGKHSDFRKEVENISEDYAEQVYVDFYLFIELLNEGSLK